MEVIISSMCKFFRGVNAISGVQMAGIAVTYIWLPMLKERISKVNESINFQLK